jgi:hypothetical protein
MKQQDIAIVIIIVFMAGIFSFFITSKFITPSDKKLTAEVVTPISTEFPLPDNKVFNDKAVNPTVKIEIAPNNNDKPFADQEQ